MGFDEQEHREHLQLVLELTLSSPDHYIILGRKDVYGEEVTFLDIDGYPTEDILAVLEEILD